MLTAVILLTKPALTASRRICHPRKGIEGDYNNVVGLPIARLYHELDSILPKEKIHYAF